MTPEQRRDAHGRLDDREGYESLDKNPVRYALVEDQLGLCCYCMRRIGPTPAEMRIEHFHPRSTHPDLALDWGNLLGACCGGENAGAVTAAGPRTCDVAKGERPITLDPHGRGLETLRYGATGKLFSTDDVHQREIDDILNLNTPLLARNRRSVLDAVIATLRRRLGHEGGWSASRLLTFLREQRSKRPAPEYLGLIEDWIERHASRRK